MKIIKFFKILNFNKIKFFEDYINVLTIIIEKRI